MGYIMRQTAMTEFQAENMPEGGKGTRVFFETMAEGRPNARVCDKLMIPLPVELSREQRHEAIASFMQGLGKGKIAWCAAHHDAGKDEHNPHAHVVFLDRDLTSEKGGKVIGTTTSLHDVKEATARGWKVPPRMTGPEMRVAWCDHLNRCMEKAGLDIRYDHRSYKDQGIDKQPQIHVGPQAQKIREKGLDIPSQERERGGQIVPYTFIDQGSRAEHNARIVEGDRAKAREQMTKPAHAPEAHPAREPLPLQQRPPTNEREQREQHEKAQRRADQSAERKEMFAQQAADREALRQLHKAQLAEHKAWGAQLYAEARDRAYQSVKDQSAEKWKEVRSIKNRVERNEAIADMKLHQKQLYEKATKATVAATRPEKNKAYLALKEQQEKDRKELGKQHRDERAALARQHIAERLGIDEGFRAERLAEATTRLSLRMQGQQGMAAQQAHAHEMMKLHQQAQMTKTPVGFRGIPQNPQEASAAYMARAHAEHGQRGELRTRLLMQRDERVADRQSTLMNAAGRLAVANRQTQTGAAKGVLRGVMMPESPQARAQQAAQSGRPLSSEEKANASPELKAQIAREERKAARNDLFMWGGQQQPKGGKEGGRGGGGRGR